MFTLLMEALASMFYFTGYIRSQSFAKPLSKEEEEKCIALLQQQDRGAREKLIEHNLRLVAHIVKKYDIKKTQSDDLISIGTIGLIKAIDSFQPAYGKKLTTYASRCIENEILMYLRKNKNSLQEVSLNEPIANEKDGSEITLLDAIAAPPQRSVVEQIQLEQRLKQLEKYLPLLDERELLVLEKRFGLHGEKEQTQKQIAEELSISRSYISRIEKRAFLKLYKAFRKEEQKKHIHR
ncbi:RNA polymerase sporulation sigma factor SigK [Merdibacter massiliensis]|nr:RNA polymerase sporulation sigma factor SigK [Merdibacter massiliensis]